MYKNPSIPTNITSAAYPAGGAISPALSFGGTGLWQIGSGILVMTSGAGAPAMGENPGYVIEAGFDLATGNFLWINNNTETAWTRLNKNFYCLAGDGVYIDLNLATDVMNGYSLFTGDLLWTNT